MSTLKLSPARLLTLGFLFAVTIPLQAQDFQSLSDVLPPQTEDVDDIELVDDWGNGMIALVGTPDDDKILIEIDRNSIRFHVNDKYVGRIREDDLPSEHDDAPDSMNSSPSLLLKVFVSGGGGDDFISVFNDPDGPSLNLFDRVNFVLYGADGFDVLVSEGVDQVRFIGGPGTDILIGDGFGAEYLGSELLVTDWERFEAVAAPDGCRDRIFPGHPESTAYRNYFLDIAPVSYVSPSVQTLDKNPPKLPGLGNIASREKGDVVTPQPIVYDSILLERDEVNNEIGCLVFDLHFREDGTMLPPTLAE
ncbi:hypothetical protein N9N28_16855 [Rubripirellula amarantea]|nr:hypothetical protein [Rubripirellula amarantea]